MAEQPATSASPNRWSAKVTRESNALSLEKSVFTWKDPKSYRTPNTKMGRHYPFDDTLKEFFKTL